LLGRRRPQQEHLIVVVGRQRARRGRRPAAMARSLPSLPVIGSLKVLSNSRV
jgi:hypothetical protein